MLASLTLEHGFAAPNFVELDETRILRLGRNRTNDVVLHDQHASRWHAELVFEEPDWILRDLGTTNGTKVNGTRITGPTPLKHGELVGIGEVRLRFADPERGVDHDGPTPRAEQTPPVPSSEATTFQADELSTLVAFMTAAVHETTPNGLAQRGLEAVIKQLHPTCATYHSLDRQAAFPRIVLPKAAPFDGRLSQELTDRVQADRATYWVGTPLPEAGRPTIDPGEFSDALCVPLLAGDDVPELFGLLQIFQKGRRLSERQVHFCEVLASCLASNLRVLRVRRNLEAENLRYRGVRMGGRSEEMVGTSEPMQKLRDQIRRFADKTFSVLIQGESGAGKQLVGLALHRLGTRRRGPFIEVNCPSVPKELAESQFFGHVRGAFSGAVSDHAGHFQQADEGILFLDGINDLSLEVQGHVLRAFEGENNIIRFVPVGGREPVQVSVRIVATSNRDLQRLVDEGRFREDLYFRLGPTTIHVPALRDHAEDIPDLIQHFLDKFNQEYYRRQGKIDIADEAIEALVNFPWPGNVRQLRAVLERALAMCEPRTRIEVDDLSLPDDRGTTGSRLPTLNVALLEEMAIIEAMQRADHVQTRAADTLGMHRDTLRNKWEKIQQKQRDG